MALLQKFKKQINNLSLYFLASLIPMVLSLVTNPLIAKNMSPTDYAIVGYYQAFNTLFIFLVNYYLLHYFTKRFFELDEDRRIILKATLFKALIVFSFLMTLVALILLYLYISLFNKESSIPFFPYAILSVFSLPITGIYQLTLVEYRMNRQSKRFFNLSVTNGLLGVLLTLFLVVVLGLGAIGKLSAIIIASSSIFLYVLIINKNLLKIPFDKKIFKEAIRFCTPLVFAAMLTFFSNGYDRVVLEKHGDINALGYYVVAVSIAGYLHIFSNSINDTFQPDIFQSVVKRDFKKCFKIVATKIFLITIVVLGFIILAPFLIDILTAGRYVASTPFAQIISLSVITSMMYYSVSQITVALGYTSITLINKIIGSVLSVLVYTLLINQWGVYGAAWGTVISFLLFFIGNVILVIFKFKRKK